MQTRQYLIPGILSAVLAFSPTSNAFEAFGFTSGMSQKAVEQASGSMNLGIAKWFGETLIVQAQDNQNHIYVFNFCSNKLYSVSQTFPAHFEQMAMFVDDTIKQFGQPILVSAGAGMGAHGYIRPMNLYWEISTKDYLRLMQLSDQYSLIYEHENSCMKVPN